MRDHDTSVIRSPARKKAGRFDAYEAQVSYYTDYIKSRDDWEFVAVYADEGISGCATKDRDGFNTMIADALAGKIDLIITKSVSRSPATPLTA